MTLDKDKRFEIYRRMLNIRYFEKAAEALCKSGDVPGFCHSATGQEAAIVGACMALRDDDFMTGTHRSHGHPIGKGADLNGLMSELLGKATGVCKGRGGSMHFADAKVGIIGESAIVGGGIPLATGAGLSAQVRGTDQVGLCFFGDGAVNQGTFHESINMASIWKLPVIYFCENNLYAISTPLKLSHGQPEIAKRANGYGIPGVVVDGQDVEAVYEVTRKAVERARSGDGPTLIEANTYRFDEHAIGMSFPMNYRSDEEVINYKNTRDPLVIYKNFLIKKGIRDFELLLVEDEVNKVICDSVTFAKSSPFPDVSGINNYMYSDPINCQELKKES